MNTTNKIWRVAVRILFLVPLIGGGIAFAQTNAEVANVTVKVYDNEKKPIVTDVEIRDASVQTVKTGETSADGIFQFAVPVAQNPYYVTLRSFDMRQKYYFSIGQNEVIFTVMRKPSLPPTGLISFNLRVRDGMTQYPIVGARVTILTLDGIVLHTETTYEGGIIAGTNVKPNSVVIVEASANGYNPSRSEVTVTPQEGLKGIGSSTEIKLYPTGQGSYPSQIPCIEDLYSAKRGDVGSKVEQIQKHLKENLGYKNLPVTGYFGPLTEKIVKEVEIGPGFSSFKSCPKPLPTEPTPIPPEPVKPLIPKTKTPAFLELIRTMQAALQRMVELLGNQ